MNKFTITVCATQIILGSVFGTIDQFDSILPQNWDNLNPAGHNFNPTGNFNNGRNFKPAKSNFPIGGNFSPANGNFKPAESVYTPARSINNPKKHDIYPVGNNFNQTRSNSNQAERNSNPAGGILSSIGLNLPFKLPNYDPEEWWGPAQLRGFEDRSIRPFQIMFNESLIQDLRYRLKNHRPFVPPLEGVAFNYGFNSDAIEGWLQYWADEYPFEYRERCLNQFPQYKTNIQGLDIHFIWIRPQVSPGVEVVPLLMMHGWPGSVREFYEAIPLVTAIQNDRDFAVEAIVPSLPGFGFSDATVRTGLGPPQIGVIMKNLMQRLGHQRFYIQGGDVGGIVGKVMATIYPEDILGYHTNLALTLAPPALFLQVLGSVYPPLVVDPALADRMYPLTKTLRFLLREFGYLLLQATKPDTVGVGLSDSPAGLLAYILEKFSTGTNNDFINRPDGGLDFYHPDRLIDNLMMYWTTNSITTSARFYAELFTRELLILEAIPTPVPSWAIQAKYELTYQSPLILRVKFPNLLNATVLDFGGHFFAFEQPQVFAGDLLTAIGEFRRWHMANDGQSQIPNNMASIWSQVVTELSRRVDAAVGVTGPGAAGTPRPENSREWVDNLIRALGKVLRQLAQEIFAQ